MQDERTASVPYNDARRVEAAILALVVSEDWPWREHELAERVGRPADLVRVCVARLRADGLLNVDGTRVRASLAAVRFSDLSRFYECC